MQEFLTNNTVNCNLMSLTGYRTLVILSLLMEAPKSADEINEYFFNNQYIKETFSNDTLRMYINSLRTVGCEITRANKSTNNKFVLKSHPFEYDIQKSQLKALLKFYKDVYDKIDFKDVVELELLFSKITSCIKNQKTQEAFSNISVLKNIDKKILKDCITHCKNKNQIVILYKSPHAEEHEIEIIADKLEFKSAKLYLWGTSITHGEYSYLRMDRISKISMIKMKKDDFEPETLTVVYELYNQNAKDFVPSENERIIEKDNNKIVIEITSKNKFELMQKFLFLAKDCKIVKPFGFKSEFVEKLKLMKEVYS